MTTKQEIIDYLKSARDLPGVSLICSSRYNMNEHNLEACDSDKLNKAIVMIRNLKPEIRVKQLEWEAKNIGGHEFLIAKPGLGREYVINKTNSLFVDGYPQGHNESLENAKREAQRFHDIQVLRQIEL